MGGRRLKKDKLLKVLDNKEKKHNEIHIKYNSCKVKDLKIKLGNNLINLEFDIEHIKHILKKRLEKLAL